MGDNDKPFACSEPDCGQRFANEDHLIVHRLKHQMSLTLTPGSKTPNLLSFVDQTPTPTKFLRNCEEIGLFSEFSNNPFEEAFKRAAKNPENLPLPSSCSTEQTQESLNTPTPLALQSLASESTRSPDTLSTPAPSLLRHDSPPKELPARVQDITYAPLPGPSSETGSTVNSAPGDETPPDTQSPSQGFALTSSSAAKRTLTAVPTTQSDSTALILTPKPKRLRSSSNKSQGRLELALASPTEKEVQASGALKLEPSTEVSSSDELVIQEEEVITHGQQKLGKVMQQLGSPTVEKSSPEDAAKTLPSLAPASSPVVPTIALTKSQSQYMLQVMVQMPNGQAVPVHIPASFGESGVPSAVPAPTTVMTKPQEVRTRSVPVTVSSTSKPAAVCSASASTKQKLKEAIRLNAQHGVLNNGIPVASDVADDVKYVPVSSPQGGLQMLQVKSLKADMSTTHQGGSHTGGRVQLQAADTSTPSTTIQSKKTKEQLDAEDRRQKFLERNRAAAARCRSKKKIWTNNLEKKAEELQSLNSRLQSEVTALRSEVTQLKSLLLAHKDCPITLEQQKSGQLSFPSVSTGVIQAMDNRNIIIAAETTSNIVTMATATTTASPNLLSKAMSPTAPPVILNVRQLKPSYSKLGSKS